MFFISDLHFGHKSVLKFTDRPFNTVEEMDQGLIDKWNSTVTDNDFVYILGDWSFHKEAETYAITQQLRGRKCLLLGNHDQGLSTRVKELFWWVKDYHELKVKQPDGKQVIVLGHYPFRSWNRMGYGSYNLHGHSHNNLKPMGRQLDVGVDSLYHLEGWYSYAPVPFEVVKAYMDKQKFVAVDHHRDKISA